MTENNTEGLHSVTYLALIILAAVIFFYLRKRHEHNRLNEVRLYTSVQPVSSLKTPLGYSPQPFQEPGTGLPTFSAQEAGQRKMPKEIDHTNVNRKNLSTISDFANNISTFEPFSRSKDQLNNTTEKMFRDSKRQQPYEPSRLVASPPITSPKGWKPDQTRKLSCDSFVICEVESSFRSGLDFPVPSGNDPKGFSHPIVPRNIQSVQVLKETVVTNDQDLTKDLEIEYRAIFNQLDHDSPLRTLGKICYFQEEITFVKGSPIQPVDSKKKINSQDEDQDKSNLSILSKIDSFSKTQNVLTQKTKVPPHNQRSAQNKLVEKNEKRAKRNQVFIDNESDDEMIVEDIKDIYSDNKRPGKESKGFESSKKKYLKTNDEQPKLTSDTKTKSLEESRTERLDDSDISKASSKKRSTADLSYISERGVNNSMRRYVEKKNMREEANKANSFIVPKTVLKSMEVEKKPVDPFLMKSEEKPKASLFSAQSPLGSTPTQNKPSNFLFTNQQKSSGIGETFSSQKPSVKENEKILEEEKPAIEKPSLLQGLKNPVDKKIEEEKESPKPAQSLAFFSQPKPEEKQLSLFSQPKPAETGIGGSLFKQQPELITGNLLAKPVATQEEQKEEKPKDAPAPTSAGTSLFSSAFGNKKLDSEPTKDQEPKVESKPLFGKTDNGLFSNSGSAFSSSKNELQITKIPSNTENAAPSLVKSDSGLFGKSGTGPSIFGGAFGKPKEETSGLGLQKSSSQIATDSAPKTDEAAAQNTQEEGAKGGFFNKLIGQKPELNTLFGGKLEEKKETAPSTSLGLFSTPNTLFKTSSTENLDFSKKSDPFGNSSQPEGSGKPLFGQKTEQPLIGFTPTSTGSLFSQRDSKKTDEPKKTEDALAGFAKNPVESPKKADNPLAAFTQNPTGNLFGKRSDSPKKADKPTIEPAKAPIGNLFGQNPESPKKSEGLFGNLIKPAGEGNKPSLGLFGSPSAFGSSAPSAPANGSSGFGSLFKNDAKPPGGGLFSNLVNNNEAKK